MNGPSRRRRPSPRAATAALVLATVLAAVVRYAYAAHAGFSASNDIDGPVYFAGAVQLAHGRLPYRDFAFVQPPGVLLLGLPFALVSRAVGTEDAFTAVRLFMPLVGIANVALAGLLLRPRGALAVLAGSGWLAIYVPAVLSTRTLLLEPWLGLFSLLALYVAFDREGKLASPRMLAWAGAFMGLALMVKLWAVFPLAVLLACCLLARSPRRGAALALGAVAGAGVVGLPFALVSPGTFLHDVVVSQLHRFGNRVPFSWRMGDLLGVTVVGHPRPAPTALIVAAFAALGVFLLAVAGAHARLRRRPSQLGLCALASLAVAFAVLMVPGEFPYHYADFVSPFAALTLGLGTGALAEGFAPRLSVRRVVAPALVAAALAAGVLELPLLAYPRGEGFQAIVDRYVPAGACVVTDYTAVTIAADRFVSSDPDCPDIVDPFGLDLALDNGRTPLGQAHPSPAVVAVWRSAFARADWVLLTGSAYARIPFVPSLRHYLQDEFTRRRGGPIRIFERTSVLLASR